MMRGKSRIASHGLFLGGKACYLEGGEISLAGDKK